MDKKLKALFSYQEFVKDPELLKLKIETEEKYDSFLLTDEELSFATGGKTESISYVGLTISFNTPNGIKTDTVIEENLNQVLTSSNGWINKTDIC